jgi:two-component system, NtrC family, nitrogen regulation sensor histidine kinase NtrY
MPLMHAKKSAKRGKQLLSRFESRLHASVFFAGVPGVVLSLLLLWNTNYSVDHKLEGSALVILLWTGLSLSATENVVNSLHTLSNVISAVLDEDFSFRAANAVPGDALGDLALEINNLSQALAEERLGSLETTNLIRKVMAEAGALFAFSCDNRLQIINRAGAQFLGKPEDQVLNCTAQELGIEDLLQGPVWEVVSRMGSGAERRWIVRRASFRQNGQPHRLIVLTEASEALRAEEKVAWQRLIRVLSHEINNSLAPIGTIARTLQRMASQTELPQPLSEHLSHGLDVIQDRADSLGRFLESYTQLARLSSPARKAVPLDNLVQHVARLEPRLTVSVISGPKVHVYVDPDQLEQALINLVKNAADAVLLVSQVNISPEAVTVSWVVHCKQLDIWIRDEGLGLSQTENLFVPFYTTKESGSGVGLLLSRQIIEAHQGTLVLRNRLDRTGCEVEVKLSECVVDLPELGLLGAHGAQ